MDELRYLKRLVDDPVPSDSVVDEARSSLRDHIDASSLQQELLSLTDHFNDDCIPLPEWSEPPVQATRNRRWLPIGAAVAAVAVLASTVVLLTDRPVPASALLDLAHAVEVLPDEMLVEVAVERQATIQSLAILPLDVDDPASGVVGAIVNGEEVRRISTDGVIQIESTAIDVEFLAKVDPEAEAELRGLIGVGADAIVTTRLPDDSGIEPNLRTEDAANLAQRLREIVARFGNPDVADSAETLQEVAELHTAYVLTTGQRAAVLKALAMVDGLRVDRTDSGVRVSAAYTTERGREHLSLEFDANGWLIRETLTLVDGVLGVTPDSVDEFDARYTPPRLAP